MSDWVDELSEEDRRGWNEFVDHFRRDALEKIAGSGAFVSLVPHNPGEFDVKFAVELGAAVMLDKPILAIVMPGAKVSGKLRTIADEIVEADLDTEDGRAIVGKAVEAFVRRSS